MSPRIGTSNRSWLKALTAIVGAITVLVAGGVSSEGLATPQKSPSKAAVVARAPVVDLTFPNEIYGTVFDHEGDPATDLRIDVVTTAGTIIDTVFTDGDGFYNFFDLPAATYKLHFVGDDYYQDEWYENAPARTSATSIPVSNTRGWIVDAEVTWVGDGGGGGGTASVEGEVNDSNGFGLEDVEVLAFNLNREVAGTATTDSDGRYLIEGLSEGRYTLCFDSADYEYACLGEAPDADSADFFWLGDGETYYEDFTLCVYGTVAGLVVDSDGSPIEFAEVRFYRIDRFGFDLWDYVSATTDADGLYSKNVAEGSYKIASLIDDDESPLAPQWWNGVSSSNFASRVIVSSDSPQQDVDFELREGSSIGVNAWCSSSGNECDETPWISLFPLDGTLATDERQIYGSQVVFNGVPPGRYKIRMNNFWWGGDGSEENATVLTVGEAEDIRGVTHVFPANESGATIAGVVTDQNGDPAADYRVTLWASLYEDVDYATTDADGYYEFAGVTPGAFSLSFTTPSSCDDDGNCVDTNTD